MKKPREWDLEGLLFWEISTKLAERFGVVPSRIIFETLLRRILKDDTTLSSAGLEHPQQGLISRDNLVKWLIDRICETPDGLCEVIEPEGTRQGTSPLYHAALETLRTARGQLFSTIEVADRLHYSLSPVRARRLRQLRRLLERVCKENGGKIKRINKATTRYGM